LDWWSARPGGLQFPETNQGNPICRLQAPHSPACRCLKDVVPSEVTSTPKEGSAESTFGAHPSSSAHSIHLTIVRERESSCLLASKILGTFLQRSRCRDQRFRDQRLFRTFSLNYTAYLFLQSYNLPQASLSSNSPSTNRPPVNTSPSKHHGIPRYSPPPPLNPSSDKLLLTPSHTSNPDLNPRRPPLQRSLPQRKTPPPQRPARPPRPRRHPPRLRPRRPRRPPLAVLLCRSSRA
jgi:hypothetical protein